jgi:hypothetical protein
MFRISQRSKFTNWHLEKYQNFRGALGALLINLPTYKLAYQIVNQFTSLEISLPI